MKLASLNEGRDGALVVVSDDLTKAVRADQGGAHPAIGVGQLGGCGARTAAPFRATGIRRDSGRD